MPQIPDSCEFEAKADQVELKTKTNGDRITIEHIKLKHENAAALAWLINHSNELKIEIKSKT